ncbi:MAG TPA: sterol desaturase family protein [Nevskiaceae bacterium]|nr:sterol desaturase family protein [Nevskiaceae bacterium]
MEEGMLRGGGVLAVLLLLAVAERRWPLTATGPARPRWTTHLGLLLAGLLLLRGLALLVPAGVALGAAGWAAEQDWGLLQGLPLWIGIPASLLLLDLLIYAQHRLLHGHPLLWRLHRVHHRDPALELSSAWRFHPIELLVSSLLKALTVLVLGLPLLGVLLFETLLAAAALFTHANLRLAPRWEQGLRPWLVTPALHRRHHARDAAEVPCNYGTLLSLWDRLFGTLQAPPLQAQPAPVGLSGEEAAPALRLRDCLLDPWRRPP